MSLIENIPDTVSIVEVAPRDGLQNEKPVSLDAKIKLVDGLAQSGLKVIEIGSFVSQRWVPQMADTAEIMAQIGTYKDVDFPVLVPNPVGLELAKKAGATSIAIFASATESFARANLNTSRSESIIRFSEVASLARDANMKVRGYVSCAVHCPYEGWVSPHDAARCAELLMGMGCYEVSMCDTTGASTPPRAAAMADATIQAVSSEHVAVHFHDTFGRALANTFTCLQLGISTIDSSVSGLGGCPYSPGAAGNLATEDLLHMLDEMGVTTGVDLQRVAATGRAISKALGRKTNSRVASLLERDGALKTSKSNFNQSKKMEPAQ